MISDLVSNVLLLGLMFIILGLGFGHVCNATQDTNKYT